MIKQYKMIVFLLGLSLALIGCSNNKVYEQMMAKGLERIEKEEFAKAESFFEMALEEKPEDEHAKILSQQTKLIQQALEGFSDGNLDKVEEVIGKIMDGEEGSELLVKKAKAMQKEIKVLKTSEKEYLLSFENAKKQLNEQAFDASIQTLEALLQQDLTHPFYKDVKQKITSFIEEVKIAKDKAAAEARAEEERQAALAKKAEEERMAAELKAKEEEERKAAKLKAEAEKKAKEAASKDIGTLGGYWLNDTMACHITSEYVACALAYSDFITFDKIKSIKHVSDTEIELIYEEGSVKYDISNKDKIKFADGEFYQRVSKEEANAIYDGYYKLP
ncbi:hypothetical protein [Lederbergia lenta]|uniref:Lipoprotein n=1 Tax=Lederbergia lenta TaxID=1467 RepID=A0A2X4WHG6_LEDLE|nr:hypothetical protein [Lederbergia lenta]MCM3112910.1 hypothetical protein [Lederbergia lenta]MEC2326123.1 hypothetical protein [Lederbergia lenta]SQI63496.1 lipoprotein [Lederbergia lenta]